MKRPDACRAFDRGANHFLEGMTNQPAESLEENTGASLSISPAGLQQSTVTEADFDPVLIRTPCFD